MTTSTATQNDNEHHEAKVKEVSPSPSSAVSGVSPCSVCPQCKGFGVVFASFAFHQLRLTCDMCDGIGKVDDAKIQWRTLGAIIKGRRLAARMTLRAAATYHGMDASNLSKMERGCICPRPMEYPQNKDITNP